MECLFSEDLKWRIVYLHQDRYSKRWISKLLYISYSGVCKTLRNFRRWNCVENPFKGASGHKKLFKDSDMKIFSRFFGNGSNNKQVNINSNTVALVEILQNYMEEAERNELLRSAFIAKIGNGYVPEQFVFLDESAKDERTLSRRYRYSYMGTKAQSKVMFVRGKRYMILLALTIDGIVAVEVIERSYNKKKFKDFIYTQVIPHMNPFPGKNSVLIMDNARIHYNAEWISVIEELEGHILFLLSYFLDFNPIELAFSTIKAWLRRNNDFVLPSNSHQMVLVVPTLRIYSSLVLLSLLTVMVMLSSSLLALVLY
ncbi:5737_t:CDS:2, partial [Acaulospora morrowiae]